MHVGIEVLNVGDRLNHGDAAWETDSDFLLITETRLIPARSRNECAELRKNNLTSVWSPAFQDTSHVGAAGIGLVSMKGAPVNMPSIPTPESRHCWHMGRVLHGFLPTGSGRIAHTTLALIITGRCKFF